jgi:hypothetical protein
MLGALVLTPVLLVGEIWNTPQLATVRDHPGLALIGGGVGLVAVAALAWAIGNGFLVNQFGELRWHPGADVPFLIGLLVAVAVGMTVAQIRREVRTGARMRPFVALLREDPQGAGPGRSGRWAVVDCGCRRKG